MGPGFDYRLVHPPYFCNRCQCLRLSSCQEPLILRRKELIIITMRYPTSTADNRVSDDNYVLKCTDLPQFDALLAQAELFRADDKLHLRHLCNDTARCASLVAIHTATDKHNGTVSKIILDYCRQRVTGETMEQLFDLADATGLVGRCQALQAGAVINATEGKPALHHVLRMPSYYCARMSHSHASSQIPVLLEHVDATRTQIQDICFQIRSGAMTGRTGKTLTTTLVVGDATWGAQAVSTTLATDPTAATAAEGRDLCFISHADPVLVRSCLEAHDPETTLVVLLLLPGAEHLLNCRTVLQWLLDVDDAIAEDTRRLHVWAVALKSSLESCHTLQVPGTNRIVIHDALFHPRYSVCSAAGLFPLALQFSFPVLREFLDGYHDMDEHFFHAPLRDNLPVILGLLTVWNTTLLGYDSRAVIPYAHCLQDWTAWVQHVDMGSNGKRVAMDGTVLRHGAAAVQWTGGAATWPLLHQGRVVPTEFVGCMESSRPVMVEGEALSNHDELMAEFFAQPDALAYGKPLEDLVREGIPEHLREHMVFNGNRPSTSILVSRLNAFGLGQLMGLYEHRSAVAGFLWGVNSFAEFGLELGSAYTHQVRAQLSASRMTGASVQGFNASTSTLLEHYLAYGKQKGKSSKR